MNDGMFYYFIFVWCAAAHKNKTEKNERLTYGVSLSVDADAM